MIKLNKTLILTVGLPRSGKSTWAKKQGWPIVNPDSIRLALHGEIFIEDAELMIWTMAKYFVKALFLAGHDIVILDATNLIKERRSFWIDDIWKRKYAYFDATKDECINRAIKNNRRDLIPIIEKMDQEKEIEIIEINGVMEW